MADTYDVLVIGAGPAGEHAAGAGRRRPAGGHRGARTGRRGVLVLGVHPVQDTHPAGRRARRGAPGAGRRGGGHRPAGLLRRLGPARLHDLRLAGRGPAPLAGKQGHRVHPRHRPPDRGAGRRGRDRQRRHPAAARGPGRRAGHRQPPVRPSRSRPGRGPPLGQPGRDQHQRGPAAAARARRRRRRGRDGPGVQAARQRGGCRPRGGGPVARTRGAVRRPGTAGRVRGRGHHRGDRRADDRGPAAGSRRPGGGSGGGRAGVHRRPDPDSCGPQGCHRRPRPGERRAGAWQARSRGPGAPGGRRARRLVVRDRRLQRARPADPHGQIPRPHCRRRHPGPGRGRRGFRARWCPA